MSYDLKLDKSLIPANEAHLFNVSALKLDHKTKETKLVPLKDSIDPLVTNPNILIAFICEKSKRDHKN